MSKNEKLKEEIGWLKVIFGILAATDISLLAWLVQNYKTADTILLVIGAASAILITVGIVWVNRIAYEKIDELEDLE